MSLSRMVHRALQLRDPRRAGRDLDRIQLRRVVRGGAAVLEIEI